MFYSAARKFMTPVGAGLFFALALTLPLSAQSQERGTIKGRVLFDGTPPKPRAVTVAQDREVCGDKVTREELLVTNGGIQNSVVTITSVLPASQEFTLGKAVVDQKGCRFNPHVLVMAPGTLTFLNSDGILHNVHLYAEKNPPRNEAMPRIRRRLTMELKTPETIRIRCDAHPWMSGYVVVAAHPYVAVTDESGTFSIENVPAGNHTVEVWHEILGGQTREVTVKSGKTTEAIFTFSKKE